MTVFILLILFQVKHFLADYPLQGKYMLGKFKSGNEWVLPLLAHVGVHGVFTFIIVLMFNPNLAPAMALLDMVLHFIMDRVKASPELLGRYKPLSKNEYLILLGDQHYYETWLEGPEQEDIDEGNKKLEAINNAFKSNVYFWWALGLDQGVHHLTHYLIIYIVVN